MRKYVNKPSIIIIIIIIIIICILKKFINKVSIITISGIMSSNDFCDSSLAVKFPSMGIRECSLFIPGVGTEEKLI